MKCRISTEQGSCVGNQHHLNFVPMAVHVVVDMQNSSRSHIWDEYSAFPSTSVFLTEHSVVATGTSGLANLSHLEDERKSGTAACHKAPEPSLYTYQQFLSSLILTVLFAVLFFLTFFLAIVWLHTVNENCCVQRALFCYQLNSCSLASGRRQKQWQ